MVNQTVSAAVMVPNRVEPSPVRLNYLNNWDELQGIIDGQGKRTSPQTCLRQINASVQQAAQPGAKESQPIVGRRPGRRRAGLTLSSGMQLNGSAGVNRGFYLSPIFAVSGDALGQMDLSRHILLTVNCNHGVHHFAANHTNHRPQSLESFAITQFHPVHQSIATLTVHFASPLPVTAGISARAKTASTRFAPAQCGIR